LRKKEYHTLTLEIKDQERDSSGIPTIEGRPVGRKKQKIEEETKREKK